MSGWEVKYDLIQAESNRLVGQIQDGIDALILAGMEVGLAVAQEKVPVKSGNLKSTIRIERLKQKDYEETYKSSDLVFGYTLIAGNLGDDPDFKGPIVVYAPFVESGVHAQPFMAPAAEAVRKFIADKAADFIKFK